MDTNNTFQNYASQSYSSPSPYKYGDMSGGFMRRTTPPTPSFSNMPVKVVFSPEQITPQDIPINGTPALFPLNDGSKIIVKSLLSNGLFDEQVYVLQPRVNNDQNEQAKINEFGQLTKRIEVLETALTKVMNDLYGPKNNQNQEGSVNQNE